MLLRYFAHFIDYATYYAALRVDLLFRHAFFFSITPRLPLLLSLRAPLRHADTRTPIRHDIIFAERRFSLPCHERHDYAAFDIAAGHYAITPH